MGQIKANNCNLTTCRYNENGKCTNEEKRKECVEVAKNVLLVGSYDIYGCDTYSVNIKPTIEPLNTVKVSVLYNGTKETKWIDCIYTTYIKLEPKIIYGLFSHNGNKLNEKRILKWKYR